jgi:hypothetical protein
MRNFRGLSTVLAGLTLLGLGCTGKVGDGMGGPGPNPDPNNPNPDPTKPPANPPPGTPPGPIAAPGSATFRRLTKAEYNNTIRDLLGDNSAPANAFPPDTDSSKSGFFRGGVIAPVDAGRLVETTDRLATDAIKKLDTLLPCKPVPTAAADQDRCAGQFIATFGRRAFRRPLTPDEVKVFTDFYTAQRTMVGQDFPNGIRMLLSAFLLSPNFLYRWEVAPKGQIKEGMALKFGPWEMASRLSYLIWASMPDDALLLAAEQNKLGTPEQVEVETRRLLKDPRARDAMADFFAQWLDSTNLPDMTKNTGLFKTYTPAVALSMLGETREFVGNLMTTGDGKLETLLTSSTFMVDARLAALYKVNGAPATGYAALPMDRTQRGGILTQAAFLAAHGTADESHPAKRGKMIMDRIICKELPLPPDNVPDPKQPAPNLSTRERYAEHGAQQCATACHAELDPLGFAFEAYDAIGGFRTTDGGKPVDSTGAYRGKAFKNAMELQTILAQQPEVRDCMARQWLRYALRRRELPSLPGSTSNDEAALAVVGEAFKKSNYDMREMIVALTKTRAFTHRTASLGEVLP